LGAAGVDGEGEDAGEVIVGGPSGAGIRFVIDVGPGAVGLEGGDEMGGLGDGGFGEFDIVEEAFAAVGGGGEAVVAELGGELGEVGIDCGGGAGGGGECEEEGGGEEGFLHEGLP